MEYIAWNVNVINAILICFVVAAVVVTAVALHK